MPIEPPIQLPVPWVIALNVLGWPVIQIGVSLLFVHLPGTWFSRDGFFFRPKTWERGGDIYDRRLAVRRWKHLLPDGAPWLKGFAKRRMASKDASYLSTFVAETRRGEAAHWLMLAATPVFFLWNPLWADVVMCAYAIMANGPCIITQRYNRARMLAVIGRGRAGGPKPLMDSRAK